MTTEPGGEATEVVTTAAAPEAAVLSPEAGKPAERDYEAEAAEQGWRPQDEWTGKPENWKDAKTFVEYGEVNSRVFKVEKEYGERFRKLEATTAKTIARLQKAHEQEVAALTAERRAAIKEGNVEEVERIDGAIEELKEAGPKTAPAKTIEELTREFAKANDWFREEPEMARFAQEYSEHNAGLNPDITFEDNMAAVQAAVRRKFPGYFGNAKTAANAHAAVDTGGSFPNVPMKAGKGFSDLPAEARRTYENFDPKIKKALPKDQYAKEYFDA